MSEVTVSTFLFICVFHRIELFNCLLPPGNQNWSRGSGRPRLACGSRSSQCLRPHILAVWTCCLQVRGRNLGSPVRKPSRSWILQELWIILSPCIQKLLLDLHLSVSYLWFVRNWNNSRCEPCVCRWSPFYSCRADRQGTVQIPPASLTPAFELPLPLSCSNLGVKELVWLPSALCHCSAFPLLWSSSAGSWVPLPLTPRPHSMLSSAKVIWSGNASSLSAHFPSIVSVTAVVRYPPCGLSVVFLIAITLSMLWSQRVVWCLAHSLCLMVVCWVSELAGPNCPMVQRWGRAASKRQADLAREITRFCRRNISSRVVQTKERL